MNTSGETYKQKLAHDKDIDYRVVKVDGVPYVQVWDGQYCWATPKAEWDAVILELADEDNDDWYTWFCGRLSYDADFCKAHESEFGTNNWA